MQHYLVPILQYQMLLTGLTSYFPSRLMSICGPNCQTCLVTKNRPFVHGTYLYVAWL